MILAGRFGGWPGNYERLDTLERERYLNLMAIEGRVARVTADVGPEDDVIWADDY